MEESQEEDAPGGTRRLRAALLPAAQPLLEEGLVALEDYDRARFAGLTGEERDQYAALWARIQDNMRRVLE